MKTQFKSILLILLCGIIALSSCKYETANPLDAVGNDASAVTAVRLNKLINKINTETFTEISSSLNSYQQEQLEAIKELKGVDFDYAVGLKYPGMQNIKGVIIMAVESRGEVEKSLKKCDFEKSTIDERTYFVNSARGLTCVVDDRYIYSIPVASTDEASGTMQQLDKYSATPLSQWKRDVLEKDHLVNMISVVRDYTMVLSADVDKTKASINVSRYDGEQGTQVAWLPDSTYEHIGEWAKSVKKDQLLSFAIAKTDIKAILGYFGMSRMERQLFSEMLPGPLYGDLGFNGKDITDFGNISANITATSSSADAARMLLALIARQTEREMIPISYNGNSYVADFNGAVISGRCEGSKVMINTRYQIDAANIDVASMANCIAWISVNIPKSLIATLTSQDDFGLKGELKLSEKELNVDIEFTETDDSFFTNIAKILKF